MTLRKNLNHFVDWESLLPTLGIPVTSRGLPARIDCPLCGGTKGLTIYKDTISGGQWHHCKKCNSYGDMVELAAQAWQLSVDAAIHKLIKLKFSIPEDIKQDKQRYLEIVEVRKTYEEFFKRAKAYAQSNRSVSLGRVRSMLHINSDRIETTEANLFGGYPHKQVEVLLREPYGKKMFTGSRWRDVVLFPYYTAPKRLAGFLCAGRDCTGNDVLYAQAKDKRHRTREAGLWGLDTAIKNSDKHVLAVSNPVTGLQLQMRHLGFCNTPLPIVAWYSHGGLHTSRSAWSSLRNKQIIFWTTKDVDAALLSQAIQCGGWVCKVDIVGTDWRSLRMYLYRNDGTKIMKKARRHAVYWSDFLYYLSKKTERINQLTDILLTLPDYGVDLDYVLREANISRDLIALSEIRTLKMETFTLVDRPDGWYYYTKSTKAERLLTDAKLRIDRIVTGDNPRYEGTIKYKESEISFDISATYFESKVKQIMINLCLKHNLGRPLFVVGGLQYSLIDIALRLHTPITVNLTG